jgi:uncharacterized protein HemX
MIKVFGITIVVLLVAIIILTLSFTVVSQVQRFRILSLQHENRMLKEEKNMVGQSEWKMRQQLATEKQISESLQIKLKKIDSMGSDHKEYIKLWKDWEF